MTKCDLSAVRRSFLHPLFLAAVLWLFAAVFGVAGAVSTVDEGIKAYEQGEFSQALSLLRPLADAGEASAQFIVGQLYHQGKGVPQDNREAAVWFQKAADQGHPAAQNNLGYLYFNGLGVPQQFPIAYKWLSLAAAAGQEDAKHGVADLLKKLTPAELADTEARIGWMYHRGWSVTKDMAEAARWYQSAANRGHALAQNNMGTLYAEGQGVAQNYEHAAMWFTRAAEQGHARAQFNLARLYSRGEGIPKDIAATYAWTYLAAHAGWEDAKKSMVELEPQLTAAERARAYNRLGVFYQQGLGVTRDVAQAYTWYQKAAEGGYPSAFFNLGLMYATGSGVASDINVAMNWYQQAADRGHAQAQHALGVLHQKGVRGKQNYKEAIKWYRASAEQGYAPAQVNLALMYYQGLGARVDQEKARLWMEKAAEQAYTPAFPLLGRMYFLGHGVVTKDLAQAYKWMRLAERASVENAREGLESVMAKASAIQKEQGEKLADAWLAAHNVLIVTPVVAAESGVTPEAVPTKVGGPAGSASTPKP